MKKLIFIISLLPYFLYAQFAGGSGTSGDPYLVATTTQFDSIRNHKANYFKLTADLDFSGYSWTSFPKITGQINGNNKTISHLSYTYANGDYRKGLFCDTLSGTIKNLIIYKCKATFTASSAVIGRNYGMIAGIALSGFTVDSVVFQYDTLSYSSTVHQDARAGFVWGTIASGNPTMTINKVMIVNSSLSCVPKSVPNGNYVGGIGGYCSTGTTITLSLIKDNTTISGYTSSNLGNTYLGGLCGYSAGTLQKSYSKARLHSANVSGNYIGGIGGYVASQSLTNVYVVDSIDISLTSVSGKGTYFATGSAGTATSCYADSTISNAFGFTPNPTSSGYNHKSSILMKAESTYSGWDFMNVWGITSKKNGNYPFLVWEDILTVLKPSLDYYGYQDPLLVKWESEKALIDSMVISITYDSLATFTVKDTVQGVDSVYINFDTTATAAYIKVEDLEIGIKGYSIKFLIDDEKYINIDSCYKIGDTLRYHITSKNIDTIDVFLQQYDDSWYRLGYTAANKDTFPNITVYDYIMYNHSPRCACKIAGVRNRPGGGGNQPIPPTPGNPTPPSKPGDSGGEGEITDDNPFDEDTSFDPVSDPDFGIGDAFLQVAGPFTADPVFGIKCHSWTGTPWNVAYKADVSCGWKPDSVTIGGERVATGVKFGGTGIFNPTAWGSGSVTYTVDTSFISDWHGVPAKTTTKTTISYGFSYGISDYNLTITSGLTGQTKIFDLHDTDIRFGAALLGGSGLIRPPYSITARLIAGVPTLWIGSSPPAVALFYIFTLTSRLTYTVTNLAAGSSPTYSTWNFAEHNQFNGVGPATYKDRFRGTSPNLTKH